MADFIRVGKRFINTDRVTDILVQENANVWIEFAAGETIYLSGEEAQAVLYYLRFNSRDVTGEFENYQKQKVFQERRNTWEKKVQEFLSQPAFVGLNPHEKAGFQYWLYSDEELLDPTPERFQEYVKWKKEQEAIPF